MLGLKHGYGKLVLSNVSSAIEETRRAWVGGWGVSCVIPAWVLVRPFLVPAAPVCC